MIRLEIDIIILFSYFYSSTKQLDKPLGMGLPNSQYPKTSGNAFAPSSFSTYQDNPYNFNQNDQNGFNFNLQNGFGNTNGFVNYSENEVGLLGMDPVPETTDVSPEQLNLLRLAAQEIGGAQFTSPNANDKYYNFFEPSQRNSLPDSNMFTVNSANRPSSLNLDTMNFNSNLQESPYNGANNMQHFPNKFAEPQNTQESTDILAYLNQLNLSLERSNNDAMLQNNMADSYKMQMEMNGHYQNNEEHFNKMADERNKLYNYNRNNFQQAPPANKFNGENNFYVNEMIKNMGENKNFPPPNFDFQNQPAPFKPNGFHNQNDFMQRQNQMPNYQNGTMNEQRGNFDNLARDGMQQAAMMRQNQEIARQMSLLMRNRPPPNQLNVDVSFLHENPQFNLGESMLVYHLVPNNLESTQLILEVRWAAASHKYMVNCLTRIIISLAL